MEDYYNFNEAYMNSFLHVCFSPLLVKLEILAING